MKIGQKIALALLGITVTMVGMFAIFQRPVLIDNFRKLQFKKAELDHSRSREAIKTEIAALGKQTQDWGSWDDTYLYVQGRNDEYPSINLTANIYNTSHIDLIFIVNSSGKVVHGTVKMPDGRILRKTEGFDPIALTIGTQEKPGPGIDAKTTVSGLDSVGGIPMIIFGRPIIDSSQLKPTKGAIFMGRFLLPNTVAQLSKAVSVPFALEKTETVPPNPYGNGGSTEEQKQKYHSRPDTDDDINCYDPIMGTSGQSHFSVRSQTDPDILRDGIATVDQVVRFVALIAILASAFGLLIVHWLVAAPLFALTTRLSAIGKNQDVQVGDGLTNRNDEVGVLARHFQDALLRLSNTQTRLLHASREAGMAEVARGVLHNAGNVLNSVTVSVNQLKKMSDHSKVAGLTKTIALMEENSTDLEEFLRNDAKGVQVLPYLSKLSDALQQEHTELRTEIEDLNTLTRHLGEVVHAQHVFAAKPDREVPIDLKKTLEEAVQIVKSAFERHSIQTELHCTEECVAMGDPMKLVQVLINILTNGKDALSTSKVSNKTITVTAGYSTSGQPEITFEDNGTGIAADKLTQIFQHGFSTKKSGIGYGLHYCANALSEMGWSIRAESDGPDKGARFILTGKECLQGEVAA